jgi:hypothetical protein
MKPLLRYCMKLELIFGFEPLLRIWAYDNHSFTRIERGTASAAALYR